MINILVNQLLSKLGGTSMDKLVRKFCHVTQNTNIHWTPLDRFVTRTCLISCETVLSWRFISRRNENPRWHHLGFRSCKPCVKYFQLDFLIIRAFEVLIVNHFKVIAALGTVLRWARKNWKLLGNHGCGIITREKKHSEALSEAVSPDMCRIGFSRTVAE